MGSSNPPYPPESRRDAVRLVQESCKSWRRPSSSLRMLGAIESVYRVRGRELLVGFVVDDARGETVGFEVLYGGDVASLLDWLVPYADAIEIEVLVTDGHEAYGGVASALELEH